MPRLIGVVLACGALIAACGSSSKPATNAAKGKYTGALAFSKCMRSHGVPNFPDPGSNGRLPKGTAQQFGVSSSQLQAAQTACQHLYPATGGSFQQQAQQCYVAGDCPPAIVQQVLIQLRTFAQCMRSHGVPNWPDATADSHGRAYFNTSALGLPHSKTGGSPVDAKIQECEPVMHPDVPWGEQ